AHRHLHSFPTRRSSDLFLYALGQAQRMQGDCRAAAASYRAYLRTSPPERSAAPARENLKRCEALVAATPAAPVPVVPTAPAVVRSEEHTSELQSRENLV